MSTVCHMYKCSSFGWNSAYHIDTTQNTLNFVCIQSYTHIHDGNFRTKCVLYNRINLVT